MLKAGSLFSTESISSLLLDYITLRTLILENQKYNDKS